MWSFIRDSAAYSFYAIGLFALLFLVAIPIGTAYMHPIWEPDQRLLGYIVAIIVLATLVSALRHRKEFLITIPTTKTSKN